MMTSRKARAGSNRPVHDHGCFTLPSPTLLDEEHPNGRGEKNTGNRRQVHHELSRDRERGERLSLGKFSSERRGRDGARVAPRRAGYERTAGGAVAS
jgi:hypothetical protein